MPPKSTKAQKRKSSIMVTTKKCTNEKKLSEKLKWSHRDLEKKRNMLIKEYEGYCKRNSYLETEISILKESNSENHEMTPCLDLTKDDL